MDALHPLEVDVLQVASWCRQDVGCVIDCRSEAEWRYVNLLGSHWIPMQEIPESLEAIVALPEPRMILCHHGIRSLQVARFLSEQGIASVSVAGGIDAWSARVDPAVRRY